MPPHTFDYDLFVIGAGSGGVRAARLAASDGLRVAVAEEYRTGGTCVVRGCVPKKFMVMASAFSHDLEVAASYGWSVDGVRFDWAAFRAARDAEIERLSGLYAANLAQSGAELMMGRARLLDAHTVEMAGQNRTVTARHILIATGGQPVKPAGLAGVEHAITSNEAFELRQLPRSILIVGGSYIAVEFASIFNGLGVQTTLAYRGSPILRGFDDDVRQHLQQAIAQRGIHLRLQCQHRAIEPAPGGGLTSHFQDGPPLHTDAVMFATGRAPSTEGLGLERAGVQLNADGSIAVDAYSRTSVPNIWAIGDVTNRVNLTPVAIREAAAFHETAFRNNPQAFDHDNIATAVFSQPPAGVVGLSEAQALQQCPAGVDIYTARFRPMKYTLTPLPEKALLKLVVDTASQRVLGVHIVGDNAPELIQLAAIAVKAGLTKPQWDATCAVHPTLAEELVTLRDRRRASAHT